MLDGYLCLTDKMSYLSKLNIFFSKTTDDLSTKMCQVMNLHCYAPVFTLRAMQEKLSTSFLDRILHAVQLGPHQELPYDVTYIYSN